MLLRWVQCRSTAAAAVIIVGVVFNIQGKQDPFQSACYPDRQGDDSAPHFTVTREDMPNEKVVALVVVQESLRPLIGVYLVNVQVAIGVITAAVSIGM